MATVPFAEELRRGRRMRDWLGDRILLILTLAASLAAIGLIGLIAWRIIRGAHLAFSSFGISFLWDTAWDTNKNVFGALPGLYGTAVTSLMALIIATPLAPSGLRVVVGALVDMLAAIPSVVLGLWGILILGPFLAAHIEPWLNRWFGW